MAENGSKSKLKRKRSSVEEPKSELGPRGTAERSGAAPLSRDGAAHPDRSGSLRRLDIQGEQRPRRTKRLRRLQHAPEPEHAPFRLFWLTGLLTGEPGWVLITVLHSGSLCKGGYMVSWRVQCQRHALVKIHQKYSSRSLDKFSVCHVLSYISHPFFYRDTNPSF